MFSQVQLIEKTVAETLSDQSHVFSYGVVYLITVTTNKIVSYKCVYFHS